MLRRRGGCARARVILLKCLVLESERRQQEQYDSIIDAYESHYSDEHSRRYRDEFINRPLTAGLDLRGKRVMEAMCGGGPTTPHLLSLGAEVTGLDISPKCVETFRKAHPDCEAVRASISETGLPEASFDAIVVVGGLHHLHPGLDAAMDELHRVLKPGGHLCFAEASAGSLLNAPRALWYKMDPLFEKNERPISLRELQDKNAGRFDFVSSSFRGNIAYLLVFNSMVFRIPHGLKAWYSPFLLTLERALGGIFSTERTSCFVVAQWRKK